MALIKIAGKQFISSTYTDTELTFEAGVIDNNGQSVASAAYSHTQLVSVAAGDIVTIVNPTNGSEYGGRYVTAYNNAVVVPDKGIGTAQAKIRYVVPDGVNGLIFTLSNPSVSLSARITKENAFARALSVDANGILHTKHVWEAKEKKICLSQQIRDTDAHVYPANGEGQIDISDYAVSSIRIRSSLDQPCTIRFYDDTGTGASWLANANGEVYAFTVPVGNVTITLLPEDFPPLYYLQGLRIRVSCASSPTSGALTVIAICRR